MWVSFPRLWGWTPSSPCCHGKSKIHVLVFFSARGLKSEVLFYRLAEEFAAVLLAPK